MSVVHGGPNLSFFSPVVVKHIMGEQFEPTVNDIPEPSFRDQVKRVRYFVLDARCAS